MQNLVIVSGLSYKNMKMFVIYVNKMNQIKKYANHFFIASFTHELVYNIFHMISTPVATSTKLKGLYGLRIQFVR